MSYSLTKFDLEKEATQKRIAEQLARIADQLTRIANQEDPRYLLGLIDEEEPNDT